MRNKVVIFIDVVASKNKLQLNAIQGLGYQPIFYVENIKPGSEVYFENGGQQQKLEKNIFKRLTQLFFFFKKNQKSIHHVEIYPGGVFSFIYIIFSKLFFIKIVCAERGDLLYYHHNGYSLLTRFSMWVCYKLSNIVWYRELYMKAKLEKITTKGLFFLHNAIEIREADGEHAVKKDIDFLWLNRIIPERKYKWVINILKKEEFQDTCNYMVGLLPQSNFYTDQQYVEQNKPSNLTVQTYNNTPSSFYKRARFFILPADVVFANHALLEAMSYGVVPLISRQLGSDLIVDHQVNGFIFEHTEEAMKDSMHKAIALTVGEYELYSKNASQKIKDNFSSLKYIRELHALYNMLD